MIGYHSPDFVILVQTSLTYFRDQTLPLINGCPWIIATSPEGVDKINATLVNLAIVWVACKQRKPATVFLWAWSVENRSTVLLKFWHPRGMEGEPLVKSLEEKSEEADWQYHVHMYHFIAKQRLTRSLKFDSVPCHNIMIRMHHPT